jgi:predicted phage tail protein
MGYDELLLPFGSKPLMVVPVITGSGGDPTTQILVGVGLVALAAALPGAGLFAGGALGFGSTAAAGATVGAATALGTSLTVAAGNIGIALILGGTAQLLSPQPELANAGADRIQGKGTRVRGERPDGITRGGLGQQSYAFTGPANTVGTGATIPVIYGRVITGAHLLAANVEVADDSDPLKLETQTPGLRTLRVNGQKLTRELQSLGGLKTLRGKAGDLVVNADDTNKDKKIAINKVFGPNGDDPLEEGEVLSKSGLEYYRSERRKKFDVIFQIDKGLFDFAGAKGSTKIDGFITYQIKLEVSLPEGNDIVAASARATIQGLLLQTQDVTYAHRLEMPRIGDGRKVTIKVEIIDVAVHENARLRLQAYGYDLI